MFTVLVTFPFGTNTKKQYAFKYTEQIPADSIVVVDTQHGLMVAKVAGSILPKQCEIKPTKWVFGLVDHKIYDVMREREEQMKKLTTNLGNKNG